MSGDVVMVAVVVFGWALAVLVILLFFAGAQDVVPSPARRRAMIMREIARAQAAFDRLRSSGTGAPSQHGKITVFLPKDPFVCKEHPPSRWFN